MESREREWEDTNDSWIWDVDESQYGEGDVGEPIESFYTFKEVRQVKSKKYRTTAVDHSVRFNDLKDLNLIQEYERTQRIFEQLLNDVTHGMREDDLIRFVLRTEQLDKPISLPFMPLSRLTPERVFSQIERVVQSHQDFRLNESVIVDIVHVEMPNGSGKRKRDDVDLESYLQNKRSVVTIKNQDDLCLARALVVAIANVDKDERHKLLADSRKAAQRNAAHELHRKAGVPLGPCGISEVKQFQKYLVGMRLTLFLWNTETVLFIRSNRMLGRRNEFICICTIITMMLLQQCQDFLIGVIFVTCAENPIIVRWIMCVMLCAKCVVG